MGMFRRSRKPAPPLHRKQQEIAQQEAQLREKVERRFHVSIAMDAPQVFDDDRRGRRPRAMRKERRQGRIVFLILLAALGVAVMLLISHLHP
jgi:hypothetical protein